MKPHTEARLKLLTNGYSPTRNRDKRTFLKDWPGIELTEEVIRSWDRQTRDKATGIRIENGLCAMDFDIDDKQAMNVIANRVFDEFPELADPATPLLMRKGKGHKEGWFVRTSEEFGRIHSRAWTKPGEGVDDGTHRVEIFGGSSPRQFGCLGAHTVADDGAVEIEYQWRERSPLDTRFDELPELTKSQFCQIADIVEEVLQELGWELVERSSKGENNAARVYDLTDEMVFNLQDGRALSLSELREAAAAQESGLRCSASFLPEEEAQAVNRTRCLIGHTASGELTIWESSHGVTHMEVSAKPNADITAKLAAQLGALAPATAPAPAPADRPVIKVVAGELSNLATLGEAALINAGAPLYVHGETIKRPVVDDVEASKGRKAKVARLVEVSTDAMRDQLCRNAIWRKYDGRSKKDVPTDPPRDVAATILSRDGEWRLPRAAGVITTPTLRPDGSILSEPGYDPSTRLVLMDPPELPAIPEHPNRGEAQAALGVLDGLLREFPFRDDASRSVALSGLITPVVRGALTVAPLHVVNAPEAGSGKSYVVDIASAIATGQRCPVIAAGRTEEETEKRLGAALMKGQALVSIDNLNGELTGDALCQYIERPVVEVRVLGQSKNIRIENRVTLYGTGCNMRVAGDLVRRTVTCSLDPNMERPELRQFKANPFDSVLADRGRYIAAALTVVRAYIAAGCPDTLPALASFEDWSRLVRSALVRLGCADPIATMEAARAEDPERNRLRQFVGAWSDAAGKDNPLTSAGLVKLAGEKDGTSLAGLKLKHLALRDALVAVAPAAVGRGEIDTLRLGKWLGQQSGRVVNGLKIVKGDDKHAVQKLWSLTEAGAS